MRVWLRRLILVIAALFGYVNKAGVPSQIGSQRQCPACGQGAGSNEMPNSKSETAKRCRECGNLLRKD